MKDAFYTGVKDATMRQVVGNLDSGFLLLRYFKLKGLNQVGVADD